MKKRKKVKVARSAITGRFIPLAKARAKPKTSIVQMVKLGRRGPKMKNKAKASR